MGRRLYSRQSNGRFRRATLENTFGLSAPTCPECGRFNPHAVNEPPPENCHACGASMKPEPQPEPSDCRCHPWLDNACPVHGLWSPEGLAAPSPHPPPPQRED